MSALYRVTVVFVLAAMLAGCGSSDVRPVRRTSATADATPNAIVFRAIALVGTPYRYGGNTPAGGFDCSGLVDYVYHDVAGIALPRTALAISEIDSPTVDRDELASGDLVFFRHRGRRVTHVGIYVGKGRFVHAPNEGGTVRLDELDAPYWREHYSGAKRVLH